MRKLALLITAAFMLIFVAVAVKPDYIYTLMESATYSLVLGAASARILYGLVLVGAAASSRMPSFLGVLGFLFIGGGIFVLFLGVDGIRSIFETFYGHDPNALRVGMLFAMMFFGVIGYALGPKQTGQSKEVEA